MLRLSWNFLLRGTLVLGIFGMAAGAATLSAAGAAPLAPETHPRGASIQLAGHYGRLPLSFEVNRGQAEEGVRFLAHGQGYGLYLTAGGAVLTLHKPDSGATTPRSQRMARRGHSLEILGTSSPRKNRRGTPLRTEPAVATDVVRMQLAGATAGLHPAGMEPLPGTANYILGNDPAKWHTGVPTYARVRYAGVYPGVDLVYYGNQRQLEYDFVVAPGADPKPIQLRFDGAKALRLDGAGNLVIAAANGEVAFEKPAVYQMAGGIRQPIEGRFQLLGDNTAGFSLGSYDRTKPLVIDPVLSYATYLGGSTEDFAVAVAADAAGAAYVTGLTWSVDFAMTPLSYEPVNQVTSTSGASTAFICKLNASGTALLYSTYLGGPAVADPNSMQGNYSHSIAVDSAGNAYVTGWTYSAEFPVTAGAFQTTNQAFPTAEATGFVTKLNANGTGLLYSTYLGGSTLDEPTSIALDPAGNVYTTGITFSTDYPTSSNAFQTANKSPSTYGWNAFVSKLNPTLSALVYSTYLGGSGEDGSSVDGNYALNAVVADKDGNAYMAGFAQSADFPVTTGVLQTTNKAIANGGTNFTLSKLNPTGTTLLYSTFLGGSSAYGDFSEGLAVDSSGNAYVTGITYSSDFPVSSGAFQRTKKGSEITSTAFAAKINPTASALAYSTYLGGSGGDDAYGLAIDSTGNLFLTGVTMSSDFPVTANAFQSTNKAASGGANAFLTELNPAGTALVYSTYLGGSGVDYGYQVALGNGEVILTGSTSSSDFPVTTAAYNTIYSAAYNTAFVAGFDLGTATPPRATATTLTASANPQLFGNTVTFTATVAPVSGTGIPAGDLVFSIDENSVATVALDGAGKATYSTSALTGGQHYVLASYTGNSTYASSGNGLIETINLPAAAAPVLSPGTGTYSTAVLVTMTDGTPGATIYYTTDGSTPTVSSATYSTPITVSSTETVQAAAAGTNYSLSPVTAATYTITYPGTPLSLSPSSATALGSGFTLTVNGANFTSSSVVLWNGAVRTTSFVSSTQLTAAILAADIHTEATDLVTVANPAPNPWTSAASPFAVMSTTPVASIQGSSIFNAADGTGNHVLSLTGSDFVPASTVQWNGTNLATSYVSPWQATATITTSEYTARPAAVTVNNPAGLSPVFELR